ncbi:MAG TPA: rubrerythrin family protein [Anaerolineae bacterium]|nr:rubrerythrin family protein [Anaerolineae bacterium]HPL28439.1 rubrerythrin family protein [Anaerolineae bacterium]
MAQLQATKTEANLLRSFAEEAQLNRYHLAYARQAEMEGYPQVSRLFRAIAESATVHANAALRVLGAIRDTRANLQGAIAAETRAGQEMYPEMVQLADQEGIRTARVAFDYARQVERIHADLLRYSLEHLDELPSGEYYVCPVCGNTVLGRPPDVCPICGTPGSAWMRVV